MTERIMSEANVDYVLSNKSDGDYIQLDYIEGTGSQYIVTDYYPTNSTRINTAITLNDKTHTTTIFSARDGTVNEEKPYNSITLNYIANTSFRMDWNTDQTTFPNTLNTNNVIMIVVDRNTTRIQDQTRNYTNAVFHPTTASLWIGAAKYKGTIQNYMKSKMFYFTIAENDILVHYFIPCKHGNKVGLYDLITGSFFSSVTSTEFVAGPEVGPINSIPKDYRLVEYIDNGLNGSYVDTNVKLGYGSRVVTRMKKLANGAEITFMFGGRNSNYAQDIACLWIKSAGNWRFDYNNTRNTFSNIAYDRELYIDFDGSKSPCELLFGVNYKTINKGSSFTSPSNFMIFGVGQTSSNNIYAKINGRFFFMRLYNNGTIVRNLWPVIRKADLKIGVYDLVNHVFYPNKTNPDFTANKELASDTYQTKSYTIQNGSTTKPATIDYVLTAFGRDTNDDERPISTSNLLYLLNGKTDNLPSGYTPLEWIESSGGQALDTGFKPTNKSRILLKGSPRTVDNKNLGCFFYGSASPDWTKGVEAYAWIDGSTQTELEASDAGFVYYGGKYVHETAHSIKANDDVIIDWNKTTIAWYRENGSVIWSANLNETTFTSPHNLYLFRLVRTNASYNGAVRINYCKIYENDTLIRDYVPCINPNGVAGMYDKVNDTFTSSNTSYAFIPGPKL